ncbi:MAG: hypothetical protein NT178_02675, partial [Proteobacteria bacterium]|nr:hypothetical protein [Pseudomonadota bacterium]
LLPRRGMKCEQDQSVSGYCSQIYLSFSAYTACSARDNVFNAFSSRPPLRGQAHSLAVVRVRGDRRVETVFTGDKDR